VRDREDQRVVKVSLSQEGQEIVCSLQPVVEAFNGQLLPGPQRQAFIEDLQRFITRVSPLVPESAGRFGFLSAESRDQFGNTLAFCTCDDTVRVSQASVRRL
jgi:hypothetical protein